MTERNEQLQTLAAVREKERDSAQVVFGEQDRLVGALKTEIQEIDDMLNSTKQRISKARENATLDAIGRAALSDFVRASEIEIEALGQKRIVVNERLSDASIKRELLRDDLVQAEQKLIAVETEIEKRQNVAKKKQERKEEETMDEIAATQWWEKS